ncbi:MAG TPA: TetR/AcrR family transcriptional regulator [Marmoricola sp.]|nr:TetR/AcrR family transcriptional regulator [Marmoricola sp.]
MEPTENVTETRTSGAGRPRDDGAEQRVIDAALEEYADGGWAAFSIHRVARRAGVGKSTIYLRWADKNELLNDAVARRSEQLREIDTGTFRGDLAQLADLFVAHLQDPIGWATFRIAVDATREPDVLAAFTTAVVDQHRLAVGSIVERAIDRGEVDPAFPLETIVEVVYGTVIAQSLKMPRHGPTLRKEDVSPGVEPLLDLIIRGVGTSRDL